MGVFYSLSFTEVCVFYSLSFTEVCVCVCLIQILLLCWLCSLRFAVHILCLDLSV